MHKCPFALKEKEIAKSLTGEKNNFLRGPRMPSIYREFSEPARDDKYSSCWV